MTTIEGGLAGNVVPGPRARRTVNYRYAPDANARGGRGALRGDARRAPTLEVRSATRRRARSCVRNPLVERLRRAGDLEVGPKQAWTPVAEFATIGVDAVNFGPGDPQYAHRDDERVEAAALVRSYRGAARRSWPADGGRGGRVDVVHLSPGIRAVEPYPFEELDRRKQAARRRRAAS